MKAHFEEALEKLRESGLQVNDITGDGSMFGLIGEVRRQSSAVPGQDEDDADSDREDGELNAGP